LRLFLFVLHQTRFVQASATTFFFGRCIEVVPATSFPLAGKAKQRISTVRHMLFRVAGLEFHVRPL
jgi:hypothetical protein